MLGVVAAATLAFAGADRAWSDAPRARNAVAQGDCVAAGEAINEGLARNDAEALFLAGFIYEQGRCVEPDLPRAARLYQRAVTLGNTDAAAFFGLMTALGRGVPQDYVAAHRIFNGDKPAADDAGATPAELIATGYAETLVRLALRRVTYPTTANSNAVGATVDVVLTPESGRIDFDRVRVDAELGSNLSRTHDFIDPIEAAYREAIAQAPRPDLSSNPGVRIVTPWQFVIPRGSDNKKIRLEGFITVGETRVLR